MIKTYVLLLSEEDIISLDKKILDRVEPHELLMRDGEGLAVLKDDKTELHLKIIKFNSLTEEEWKVKFKLF